MKLQGIRPEFKFEIPKSYRNLIEKCWSQKTFNRPTFDEILNDLKKNENYITEKVNKNDFFNYIKYIDDYKISLDSDRVISLTGYIDEESSTFNHSSSQKDDSKSNLSVKIIENLTPKNSMIPYKFFLSLDNKCKETVQQTIDDPKNQFKLGQFLIEGQYNFPRNVQLGIKYLKISFENGNDESFLYYCSMLIKGKIIPKNHKKVIKMITERYDSNDSLFLFIYDSRLKQEKKYEESFPYFENAEKAGNVDAIYELANMFYKGTVTPTDKAKSTLYYERTIEKGSINITKLQLKEEIWMQSQVLETCMKKELEFQ